MRIESSPAVQASQASQAVAQATSRKAAKKTGGMRQPPLAAGGMPVHHHARAVAHGAKRPVLPQLQVRDRLDMTVPAGVRALFGLLEGLENEKLLQAIRDYAARHTVLGYTEARHYLFSKLDNENGYVTGVYTGRKVKTDDIPHAGKPDNMNTEHTWPKSRGLNGTGAISDLHHLFPADTFVNGTRSSLPFGNVVTVEKSWPSGAKLGLDQYGDQVFEPPTNHKGNVARAMFYISAMYKKHISPHEEATLRAWNNVDVVDDKERARNAGIAKEQGNVNPFIEDPKLPERIQDF